MIHLINKKKMFLCGAFLAGWILRLIGINCGLPHLYHPDEVRQILDTLSMAQRMSLIPTDLTYPALHKYVLLLLYGVYYVIGKLFGLFSNSAEFALAFLRNPSLLFLLGRLVSVIFGFSVGLIIYKLGKNIFGQRSAMIAAIFSLFMYQLIGHSQWAIADIMVTFFTTAAFLCIFLDMKFLRYKYFYLACIFIGLCISTKFLGVFIIPPFVIGQVYLMYEKKAGFKIFFKRAVIGAFLVILFSLIGNIAFFSDPAAYIGKFRQLAGVTQIGLSSSPTYTDGFLGLLLWFSMQMVKQEMLIGVLILLGIGYALFRHDKYDLISLSYLLLFFFSLRNWGFRYLHLFTATFGIMCLLSGRLLSELLDRSKNRQIKTMLSGLIIAAVIFSAWRGLDAGLRKTHDDTRILAREWIEKNISTGSRIGIDWYVFGPPLVDDIPIVVHNPTAEKFYRSNVPSMIKDKYNKFLQNSGSKRYNVINLMYAASEPVWPLDMPEEARKRAEKMEVFCDLYQWFNFMSQEEIYQENVEYVVLSSYAYSHFLLDDDKRKTGLFNPYIFEDMITCNRQAKTYEKGSLNSLLFFLTKRARNFYLEFLDGHMQAELIKEFKPNARNLGPTIKIYKIEG